MPTYEYQCQKCKRPHEAFQLITAKPLRTCPTCGGRMKRLLGSAGLLLFVAGAPLRLHVAGMGEAVEEETIALGGSFSAEHGIGLSKLPAMGRYKDPVAMEVMRTIKRALDPNGIMNPGKVLP